MRRLTQELAVGRWQEILPALGVPEGFLTKKHQPCPMCGGKDRARFTDYEGRGGYVCSQCGNGDGFLLLQRLHGWDFQRAAGEVDRVLGILPAECRKVQPKPSGSASHRQMEELEQASLPLGGPALAYYRRRGLDVEGRLLRSSLRYVPELVYPDGTIHPGIIAFYRDRNGQRAQALRLFLTLDGQKAEVEDERMWLKGTIPAGGAIRLWAAAERMGIAEGVETAASAAELFNMPVWAAGSDAQLREWQPPEVVKQVVVFGDNDRKFAGQAAAYALAKRLVPTHEVEVRIPTEVKDWNDVLMKQKGVK